MKHEVGSRKDELTNAKHHPSALFPEDRGSQVSIHPSYFILLSIMSIYTKEG
jgi:hypothetical protein